MCLLPPFLFEWKKNTVRRTKKSDEFKTNWIGSRNWRADLCSLIEGGCTFWAARRTLLLNLPQLKKFKLRKSRNFRSQGRLQDSGGVWSPAVILALKNIFGTLIRQKNREPERVFCCENPLKSLYLLYHFSSKRALYLVPKNRILSGCLFVFRHWSLRLFFLLPSGHREVLTCPYGGRWGPGFYTTKKTPMGTGSTENAGIIRLLFSNGGYVVGCFLKPISNSHRRQTLEIDELGSMVWNRRGREPAVVARPPRAPAAAGTALASWRTRQARPFSSAWKVRRDPFMQT